MKAIGYIRVSTEEQAREGVSLEAQERSIRAYAEMRGIDLIEVVTDPGVSAKKALSVRRGGQRVIAALRTKEVEGVIAWKLDRLFRNCAECLVTVEDWEKRGVSFHLVDLGGQAVDTRSAMGKFFLTIIAAMSELERNQIRERTSNAMQHKKANGEYTGGRVPYGHRLEDGELKVDIQEQNAIKMARTLHKSGKSLRRIGENLSLHGYLPRDGAMWHASQIKILVAE